MNYISKIKQMSKIIAFILAIILFIIDNKLGTGYLIGAITSLLGFEIIIKTTNFNKKDKKVVVSQVFSFIIRFLIYGTILVLMKIFYGDLALYGCFGGLFTTKITILLASVLNIQTEEAEVIKKEEINPIETPIQNKIGQVIIKQGYDIDKTKKAQDCYYYYATTKSDFFEIEVLFKYVDIENLHPIDIEVFSDEIRNESQSKGVLIFEGQKNKKLTETSQKYKIDLVDHSDLQALFFKYEI